ncbi:translation initiation factor 4G [Paragonimus westermani]|uniref:Translation initiation factor 4G n=1 Tax=Paragonimus westermani TaxID=34504 RepID=A0A5J4P1W6_9TREM|nr:translation initiation factor 4G [Paragonimus westermani]
MECLCVFLKIVGKFMDTPRAQNLMNQYFSRLQRIQSRAAAAASDSSVNEQSGNAHCKPGIGHDESSQPAKNKSSRDVVLLPARVRFMIDDLLDLRNNGWVPRRAGQRCETNKPRYLRDIRLEIYKDSGMLVAPTPAERSSTSRDVPGSEYANHLAATTNLSAGGSSPFISSLTVNGSKDNRTSPFCPGSAEQNILDARNWLELARFGEELCRSGPGDLGVFGSGVGSISRGFVSKGQLFSRSDSGHSGNYRRFLNSKPGSSANANNNSQSNGFMTNGADIWSARRDRTESTNDSGWTRGIATSVRRQPSNVRNVSSISGSGNLPPRMLRKMASLTGGAVSPNDQSDCANPSHNLQSDLFPTSQLVDDCRSLSSWGSSRTGTPGIEGKNSSGPLTPLKNPTRSLELFEPAYLQPERTTSVKPTFLRSTQSNVDSPPRPPSVILSAPKLTDVNLRPSTVLSQPVPQTTCGRLPFAPAELSTWAHTSANRGPTYSPYSNNDTAESVVELKVAHSGNVRSSAASDEQKRFVKRLVVLFEESKTEDDFISGLQAPEFAGRLSSELVASFVLRTCEEGASFPLSSLDAFETAHFFMRCCGSLRIEDIDKKSPKLVKDNHRRPLTTVWCLLLTKLLPVNSVTFSKSRFASISAALIWNGYLLLTDFVEPLRGGKHHPLFLLVLQQLALMADELPKATFPVDSSALGVQCSRDLTVDKRRATLTDWFRHWGIRMNQMMPDGSQTNEKLLEILEERNLVLLVPCLRLSRELAKLVEDNLSCESSSFSDKDAHMASVLSEYLENYTTSEDRDSPEFVHALMPAIYDYVYKTGLNELPSHSSPSELMSRERCAWNQLISAGLSCTLCGSTERQMDAIHALQLFWMSKDKPKGFLLRCFMNLYNCDLVDENTFLTWKEELNPSYPVKGEALFEVNRWLTWLENAEEEDEEETNITSVDHDLPADPLATPSSSHVALGAIAKFNEPLVGMNCLSADVSLA